MRWLVWFAALALAGLLLFVTTDPMDAGEGHARRFFGLWRTRSIALAVLCIWAGSAFLICGRSRRRWTRTLLVTVGLSLPLLAAELAGRAGLVDWSSVFGQRGSAQLGSQRVPNLRIDGLVHEDLALAWGIPREPLAFSFQADSRGFRNALDRERADVYCLGDSMLVAGLVPFEETLVARLEQGLGRAVMSLALVGIGPLGELEVLRRAGVPLDGALVLQFVFEGNDLRDTAIERGALAGEPQRASFLGVSIPWLQTLTSPSTVQRRTRMGRLGTNPYWFRWAEESFRGLEAEVEPLLAALEQTAAQVRADGGEYALVLVPTKLRVLGPRCEFAADSELVELERHLGPLPATLFAWAERAELPFLDLTPALVAELEAGRVPWFQADTHWNAAGQQAAAAALLAWEPVRRRIRP